MLHSTFPAAWAAPACTSWLQVGTTGAPDETSSSSGSHGFALPILRQPESRHRHWQHVVAACSCWTSVAVGPTSQVTSSRTVAANPGARGSWSLTLDSEVGWFSLTPVFGQGSSSLCPFLFSMVHYLGAPPRGSTVVGPMDLCPALVGSSFSLVRFIFSLTRFPIPSLHASSAVKADKPTALAARATRLAPV